MDKRELINENLTDILPLAATFILGVAAGPAIKDVASTRIRRAIEKFTGKDYRFVSSGLDTNTNALVIRAHKQMYERIAYKLFKNKDIMGAIKRLQTNKGTEFDRGFIQGLVDEFNDTLDDKEREYLLMLADPNSSDKVLHTVSKDGNLMVGDSQKSRSYLMKEMGFDAKNLKHWKDGKQFSTPERVKFIDIILDKLDMHAIDYELAVYLESTDTNQLRNHATSKYDHTFPILKDLIRNLNNIWRDKSIKIEQYTELNYSELLEESLDSAIQYAKTNKIPQDVFDFFNAFDTTGKKKLIHQMLVWYKTNPKIYEKLQTPVNNKAFTSVMNAYCLIDRSGRIKIPDNETFAVLKTHGFTIKTDPNFKPSPKDLDDDGKIKGNKGQYGILPQIEHFKTIEPFLEKITPLVKIQTNSQLNKKARENAKILVDNDRYTILMPTTDADFCKYGLNTKWCVSDKVGKYRRSYMFSHNIKLYYILSKIYKNENDRFHKMCIASFPPNPPGYIDAFRSVENFPKNKNLLVHWFDSKNNEGLPLTKSHPMTDEMVQKFIDAHNMPDSDLKLLGWIKFDYPFTLEDAIKLCADGPSTRVGEPYGFVTITSDGTYNVKGDISLNELREPFSSQVRKSGKLPVQFGSVTGDFNASGLGLTTLENSPTQVGGNFIVSQNELTSLKGGPTSVGGQYIASYNPKLSDVTDAPAGAKLQTDGTKIRESVNEVNTKLTIKPNQNNIIYKKKTISIISSENENNPELTKHTNWKIIPNELYFVIADSAKFPSDAYHKLLYYPSVRIKKLYNAASQEVKFDEPKVKELFNKMEAPWKNPTYIQNVKY